jgi:hypothetical protein
MTDKTLKHFFEVYKPKAPDEQKFVDKHVTIKHQDRNGNGDDVFKGNTKYIKRKEERKGYDVGEDEKVYEETELEEGMMKLSKVHVVHHHDHPAAKEFAKNYTAGMKGDHREGGPNEADDKASNAFHQRYSSVRTREGFAGSGTHVYHDHKTGAKWKVDRHPNGKTFYGTDHIISHHTGDMHESFDLEEGEVLDTVAEDRVIRSLVAYYEELGEEILIDDIVAIAEEMIDELSTGTLQSYRKKARAQGNAIVDKMKMGGGDWSKDQKDTKTLRKRAAGAQASGKQLVKRGESLKTEETELDEDLGAQINDLMRKKNATTSPIARKNIESQIAKLKRQKTKMAEEVEELDEISATLASRYLSKASSTRANDSAHKDLPMNKRDNRMAGSNLAREKIRAGQNKDSMARVGTNEEVEELDETAKIVAHLQKRYGDNIRKSHVVSAAKDFGVDSSKLAKAVRTKLGKSMLDEEQIDELSATTKDAYAQKAAKQLPGLFKKSGETADGARKYYNRKNTVRKIANEEAEQIDELSKKTLGSYVSKAARSAGSNIAGAVASGMANGNKDDQRSMGRNYAKRLKGIDTAAKKLTKEEVINRAVAKYSPSEEERLSLDEQLVARIEDMKESHIHLILNLFEQLDESNQRNLLDMIDQGRVNDVLDFAISAVRGE